MSLGHESESRALFSSPRKGEVAAANPGLDPGEAGRVGVGIRVDLNARRSRLRFATIIPDALPILPQEATDFHDKIVPR